MSLELQQQLSVHFGFGQFRSGQEQAVQNLLSKTDTLIVMPTGSGKSLCYQLPALMLPDLTLVVSPLIALMKDQVDFLTSRGLAATFVNSSIPVEEQNQRLTQVFYGQIKILYVAPERFRNAVFNRLLNKVKISLLAIDEAHCISLWGHDFRPDYLQLGEVITRIGKPTVAALTATATQRVQQDIISRLGLAQAERIVTGFNRPNLTFQVKQTFGDEMKCSELGRRFTAESGNVIIYVGTRKQAEQVAQYVNIVMKVKALHYHAGLGEKERTAVQNKFMADEIQVIVATNAFGMGVDKPDIRFVIHYALPASLEAYYQEAGRAGRDGRPAECLLLYDYRDVRLQEWFIDNGSPSEISLVSLYRAIKGCSSDAIKRITVSELQAMTGLNDIQVRVGVRHLEESDALVTLSDEWGKMQLKALPLDLARLAKTLEYIRQRREHKLSMLEQMIEYAESHGCRRSLLLKHFGDHSKPEAIRCCDNCERPKPGIPKPAAKGTKSPVNLSIEHAVLWLVANHWCALGIEKIAQILGGSKASGIIQYGHSRSKLYGAFSDWPISGIEETIMQMIKKGYVYQVVERYPVLQLTEKGADALEKGSPISLQIPVAKKSSRQTAEETLLLFSQGKTPAEIAELRNLTAGTIYAHLAQAIEKGKISVRQLVSEERIKHIQAAIAKAGFQRLSSIKDILPADFTFEEIRCVVASHLRERQLTPGKSDTRDLKA